MKKFLLSLATVLAFLAYAVHQRNEADSAVVLPPKKIAANSQTQSDATAGSSSPPPATSNPTPTPPASSSGYKDGQYTGDSADAFYGFIQVKATISGGKITDVVFLDYPQDRRTSVMINSQAMPYLKEEAIAAQSANVDIVSGATDSSNAFINSLQSALDKAKQ